MSSPRRSAISATSTLRALATLAAADLVACEDTRVTAVLLRRFGIATQLVAYHDHNAARQRPKLLAALAEGKAVALVSDAGTPLVSDPGYRLVVEAARGGPRGRARSPAPRRCWRRWSRRGLPTDSFLFAGFLPPKTAGAAEAPRRARRRFRRRSSSSNRRSALAASLADMAAALGGDRAAAVARELTKTFETVRRGTLAELAAALRRRADAEGRDRRRRRPAGRGGDRRPTTPTALLAALLDDEVGRARPRPRRPRVTGLPRRDLYQRALALKDARR